MEAFTEFPICLLRIGIDGQSFRVVSEKGWLHFSIVASRFPQVCRIRLSLELLAQEASLF